MSSILAHQTGDDNIQINIKDKKLNKLLTKYSKIIKSIDNASDDDATEKY